MIVFGVFMILVGAVLYFHGNNMNNDVERQIGSLLENGKVNPGSTYMTIGLVIGVIGLVVLVAGCICYYLKKGKEKSETTKQPEKKERTGLNNPYILTAAALLAAASFVLAYLAKSVFGTGPLRVTFENVPVFLGGMLFGPIVGMLIALVADLLSCLIAGQAPNLIITAGAMSVGLVAGLLYRYVLPRMAQRWRVVISVVAGHAIGSMLIKSIGLYVYYGWSVLLRIPVYIGIAIAESVLLYFLLKNPSLTHQIQKTKNQAR